MKYFSSLGLKMYYFTWAVFCWHEVVCSRGFFWTKALSPVCASSWFSMMVSGVGGSGYGLSALCPSDSQTWRCLLCCCVDFLFSFILSSCRAPSEAAGVFYLLFFSHNMHRNLKKWHKTPVSHFSVFEQILQMYARYFKSTFLMFAHKIME